MSILHVYIVCLYCMSILYVCNTCLCCMTIHVLMLVYLLPYYDYTDFYRTVYDIRISVVCSDRPLLIPIDIQHYISPVPEGCTLNE